MKNDLNGRVALVTGSVQGIGLAIAKSLAEQGARIALHGLADAAQIAKATKVMKDAGASDVRFFGGDMRDPDAIETLISEVEALGPLDVLVNNAGIQKTVSLQDLTTETWDAIIAVNLSGAMHTMRHVMPKMAERGFGRVINIASVHGLVASKDKAPYVAAKFGLVGLSKVAALEYASAGSKESGGVTVNCICPGWTDTPLIEPQIMARAEKFGGDREAGKADLVAEKQPSRRTADPSEIGALAVWLCAPIAHNVTGTSIPIDGGWTSQ
ncbi:MAG: 3-hydroxybutyrate dehydrogenase [Paracoccaceae bacterium]|jgi:3-hydroxybutyrate dehydrogenase